MAPDSLRATSIGSKPGGKQPVTRDGWYADSDQNRISQPMVDSNGVPKGLTQVLTERGKSEKLKQYCKKKGVNDTVPIDGSDRNYCLVHHMSNQPDFMA